MEICRLCFDSNSTAFIPLNIEIGSLHRKQLGIVFPEIDLEAVSVPYLCSRCSAALESAYIYKSTWLACEEKLKRYAERNPALSYYCLSDVVNDSKVPNRDVKIQDECSEIEVSIKVETCPSLPDPLDSAMEFVDVMVKQEAEEVDQEEEIIKMEEEIYMPPEVKETASRLMANLLPEKSANVYEKQYEKFISWCRDRNVHNYTEDVFLKYFLEKEKSIKSSTLWSMYSMLKSTMQIKHKVDLSKFVNLIAFIKKKNTGYKPKKASTFTREDISRFLMEAPDQKFLMWKVCLIIGVAGACRGDELRKLTINDVKDKDNQLIINIPDSKTGKCRTSIITDKMCENLNPIDVYRKYRSLRPPHTPHQYLFVFYNLGKCSIQPVGIHTLGRIPNMVATYLKLPNSSTYTGHSFRRTSASILSRPHSSHTPELLL